jgi:hypothetical protein
MKYFIPILFAVITFQNTHAQDELPSIVTDRPDQTESSVTVPHKILQIETGFTYGWDKQDGIASKDLGYNGTLLRWGVLKRFEIRLGAAYAGYEQKDDMTDTKTTLSGFAPLSVGFKWNFLYGNGPIPTLALISSVDIPALASGDFSDGNALQKIIIAGSWDLSRTFSLGINLGTIADWEQSDFTAFYTTSLGISITSWMGAFAELYSFHPEGEYSDHRFDAGFTFPVRNNLQFDISGGMGISKNSPDGFAGLGLSWRIPK